jgi:hypothetical protein
MELRTHQDIADKSEWEGGIYEGLDWFQDNEVPLDLQTYWRQAKSLKGDLENVFQRIEIVMQANGVEGP